METQKELTHEEFGALIEAIGVQIRMHGLAFGAVLDGNSRNDLIADMTITLDASDERIEQIADMTLAEVMDRLNQ